MSEPSFSRKRIIGAALFGFAAGGFFSKATDWAIVGIMSSSQHVTTEVARTRYESLLASPVWFILVAAFTAFFGASIAGFLGRRKGVLCGVLSGSPLILLSLWSLIRSIAQPDFSTPFALSNVMALTIAASAGGLLGQWMYSPARDLDQGKDRLTVFGVYWVHYFWLLPFIFTGLVAALVVALYTTVLVFLTDFYFGWHPSLWFNGAWSGYSITAPIVLCITWWLATAGFFYFFKTMQYDQYRGRKWSRFWRASLSGLVAPALACGLAFTDIKTISNLPKPGPGDWKIALAFIVVLLVAYVGWRAVTWVKRRSAGGADIDFRCLML